MAKNSTPIRPSWPRVWEDHYVRIRDQLKAERAAGCAPRVGMRSFSDDQIERYTRREAERRCSEAVNRWNEEIEVKARKGLL